MAKANVYPTVEYLFIAQRRFALISLSGQYKWAVHGASTGTCLAIQSSFTCTQATVATASGLIFGMRPR